MANKSNSNIKSNMSQLDLMKAQATHEQAKYNNTSSPKNVMKEQVGDARIRMAVIDNYAVKRPDGQIDPLDEKDIINMVSGQVVIRYVEYKGGVVLPDEYGYPSEGYPEPWSYFPDKDSKYPEERTLDCYNHDIASEKEIIPLTHAFIWSNGKNWAGMNYLPPVGTAVIIGYRKNNIPMILGCIQSNFKACKPYLKLGETMMKGYGNNYTHWRWSDKLDNHVWCEKGEIDIDDPYKQDVYKHNLDMWVRYDAYKEHFWIEIHQQKPDEDITTSIEINQNFLNVYSHNDDEKKWSKVIISTDDIYMITRDDNTNEESSATLHKNSIVLESKNPSDNSRYEISPSNIILTSTGSMNMNLQKDISINSNASISITAKNGVNINGTQF